MDITTIAEHRIDIAPHSTDDNTSYFENKCENGHDVDTATAAIHSFQKLSYKEVEKSLEKHYYLGNSKYSTELDILITFLKSQTHIFTYAKNITRRKLNMLIIPSIFISSCITLLAPFIIDFVWCGLVISVLNAIITVLIAIVNYYQLESAYQMFSHLASQYDKLQTVLEITNSKLIFMTNNEDKQTEIILQKINDFEEKICEIKENTTVFLPEEIKLIFPLITHINIFSLIKKIETNKKLLIIRYRDVKNEIRYIQYKHDIRNSTKHDSMITITTNTTHTNNSSRYGQQHPHIEMLISMKNNIREEIVDYKNAYYKIDQAFMNEIRQSESSRTIFIQFMFLFGIIIHSDERESPIYKYIS